MLWSGSARSYRKWAGMGLLRYHYLRLTCPGFRFHCAHSSTPEAFRDPPKRVFCPDCSMLYETKDGLCYPTNRKVN